MKVAVVGTGSIGRRHLSNLLRLGVRDVVAVSEYHKRASLTIDGTEVPVEHGMFEGAAAQADAVFICNPSSMHLVYARQVIAAGKHLFLEKPISTSADGLAEICRDLKEVPGLVTAVAHQYRFNEMLETFKTRVENGELGLILSVEANLGEHIADYHPEEDYRDSYTARRDLGGGILLTQVHQIDFLKWIFGNFKRVFALGGLRSDLEIDVEDSVSFLAEAEMGTPVYGHLDYLQRPKRVTLVATGTRGRLEWDYFENSLTFQGAELDAVAQKTVKPFNRNDMFLGLLMNFLTAVRVRGVPRTTFADAAQTMHIVDAIKASFTTGQSVELRP